MDYYSTLFASKLNGGGGSAVLINKNINANGTYNASSDNADGYKKVVVDVPNPSAGTLSITENDTYDVTDYASVEVDVPTGITPSGTKSITANGTYDVTTYESADVDVPVGWTTDGVADMSQPNGAITISASVTTIGERALANRKGITSVIINGDPFIGNYAFAGCSGITKVFGADLTDFKKSRYDASSYVFSDCNHMITAVFPKMGNNANLQQYLFQNCSLLESADFKSCDKIGGNVFKNCSSLRTLVIRRTDAVATATNMGSQGFGGIYNNPNESAVYVPSALVSSYQTASNWSALYALNNNIFKAIEGSIYETQYVDGTPIS